VIIRTAEFIKSSTKLSQCPEPNLPEFAFIGRSNVGKSSLINMLTSKPGLAKTSSTPGKTQTINHFLINSSWYLVDLPGYGYAKVSKKSRENWVKETEYYIKKRENLTCLFVLLDARLEPQKVDLEFLVEAGLSQVPIARVFTKSDKAGESLMSRNIAFHNREMLKKWEALPVTFATSAEKKRGRDQLLEFIEQTINNWEDSR
jgi:GTP-binding protein